jgi:predicted protein tyrosine phosphatase
LRRSTNATRRSIRSAGVHLSKVRGRFRHSVGSRRIVCLDIPDEYEFMDPGLIHLLRKKMQRHLPERPSPED